MSLTTEEFDKIVKKVVTYKIWCRSQTGKKRLLLLKKPVAKKQKIAEKDSGYESKSSSSTAFVEYSIWLKHCSNDRRFTSNNFKRRFSVFSL